MAPEARMTTRVPRSRSFLSSRCGFGAVVVVALASACRGGGGDVKPTPAPSQAVLEADAAAAVIARASLPQVRATLSDPRLARVVPLVKSKDDAIAAALAMAEARTSAVLTPDEACAWSYLYGRLAFAAEMLPEAQGAFDAAAGGSVGAAGDLQDAGASSCPLAGYARLHAAQAYARGGRFDDALARARAVPETLLPHDEVRAVVGEALAGRGDRTGAVAEWRALLASQPKGPRWIDTSVRLATALLDGVGGDPQAEAQEAFALTTKVVVEAPKVADASGATTQRARALAVLHAKDLSRTDALSEGDRARRAQAYLDANDFPHALAEATLVVQRKPRAADDETLCKANVTRSQALARTKAPSADAWGDAIAACSANDALVTAYFSGAKASLHDKRPDEATARFAKVEELFPKHRFADDARFHAALIALDAGDEAGFEARMLALPRDYPDGDMGPEGLFRVSLLRMTKGAWADAKAPLEQVIALAPNDRHWATAGRAAYFLGRIESALGNVAGARAQWTRIVETYPLAFYMTQAYARLEALGAAGAKAALDVAIARDDASAVLYTTDHPELRSDGFVRAVRLLEVGEVEPARKELAAAGVTGEGVDAELAWTAAYLYNTAGYPEVGHGFWRAKHTDHLAHYPVGRWRVPWEVSFPRAFDSIVVAESGKQAISPALTWGIMREESGFVADAKSPSNAFGLMQLIVPTARMVAKGTGLPADQDALRRPEVNVALGTKLLAQLRSSYAANPALAIAAYNSGGGSVGRWVTARGALEFDLWVETIPYEETRGYIKRVLASEAAYAFLYARPTLDEILRIPVSVGMRPAITPP